MIHREGKKILIIVFIILVAINIIALSLIALIASFLLFSFLLSFFRKPKRKLITNDNVLFSPADGKIVVIEETTEKEYLKDKRIQISIFMSVWNVHINWLPVSGVVSYFKHHIGKYLVARHPKSSEENEQSTTVIKTNSGIEIVIKQIAGAVARRIKTYRQVNEEVNQGNELGFIRFGSRVDLFLPLNSKVKVSLNQKVRGNKTIIAELQES